MPLLGRKIFSAVKPLVKVDSSQTIYTIQQTKEQFLSKADYDKRLSLYNDHVWTCQCTGHINLTLEEALNSEKVVQKNLKDNFAECYEKFVLEGTHHKTIVLEKILDDCWYKLQRTLLVGEPVTLKIKVNGKDIKANIVKVHISEDAAPGSSCNSPSSSDKENNVDNSLTKSGKGTPKKWSHPKLLPHKYDLKLDGQDKIISLVPVCDIVRTNKPPSKELLRLFIRSNAVRTGANCQGPWVVNEKLVKKYSLKNKFAEVFVSPIKMTDKDFSPSKRKAAAISKSTDSNHINKTTPKKKKEGADVKKNTPKKTQTKEKSKKNVEKKKKKEIASLDNDTVTVKVSKSKPTSKTNTPTKLKNESTPKKKKVLSEKGKNSATKVVSTKKKGMKQMTLYDVKKNAAKSPGKSPRPKTPAKPRTPAIAKDIQKALKENDKHKYHRLLNKAIKELSAPQRKLLPENIQQSLHDKYEKLMEKRKLKTMSETEKEEYLKEKRKARKEEKKKVVAEESKGFEDLEIADIKPLPTPGLVTTPDGMPNEMFGDVAMVTQFVNCYADLLMPKDESGNLGGISSDTLMKALSAKEEGFAYLSRVLCILLQTLLQDGIAEDYRELKVKLTDIPVNQFTASELVRLALRPEDREDYESDNSIDDDNNLPEGLIESLETCEFFELEPQEKLSILTALSYRILGSYSVQDYMEEKLNTVSDFWRQKQAEQKEKKKQLEDQKKSKENADKELNQDETTDKKKTEEPKPCEDEIPEELLEDGDLASTVKRRRIMAAKEKEAKIKRDALGNERREKETEQLKKQKEKDLFEKSFKEATEKAKLALRMTPLGRDRHHNRYWVFQNTTPGLYVEKGWATAESVASNTTAKLAENQKKPIETTFPPVGQNLWFVYNSVSDVDSLLGNLHPQGVREKELKTHLTKEYATICKAINTYNRDKDDLKELNGPKELLNGIRDELLETELRLRSGGLGGVPDFDIWKVSLESAINIPDLGECMIESQANVLDKFCTRIMAVKKSKQKTTTEIKEEDEGDDADTSGPVGVSQWVDAVQNTTTISRLHVLMGILDSCIKWEKSAEHAKCKICRKKGDEDRLLLCDDCNQPFHLYCLRPALVEVPQGDWLCPACMPLSSRRKSRSSYQETETYSDDQENQETECTVCGGDEDLINCTTCPLAYHLDCHEPPLRYSPRGSWSCTDCKMGTRRKTRQSKTQAKSRVKRKRIEEDDDDNAEESEDSDYEKKSKPRKAPSRSSRRTKRVRESSDEDEAPVSKKSSTRSTSRRIPSDDGKRVSRSRRKSPQALLESDEVHIEDYVQISSSSRRTNPQVKSCEEIVNKLIKHKSSWPFHSPVDKAEVPDYYNVVKNPIDLQTIRTKFENLEYKTPDDFIQDMTLLFTNSADYNSDGSIVGDCGFSLESYFTELMKAIGFEYTRHSSNTSSKRSRRK